MYIWSKREKNIENNVFMFFSFNREDILQINFFHIIISEAGQKIGFTKKTSDRVTFEYSFNRANFKFKDSIEKSTTKMAKNIHATLNIRVQICDDTVLGLKKTTANPLMY